MVTEFAVMSQFKLAAGEAVPEPLKHDFRSALAQSIRMLSSVGWNDKSACMTLIGTLRHTPEALP